MLLPLMFVTLTLVVLQVAAALWAYWWLCHPLSEEFNLGMRLICCCQFGLPLQIKQSALHTAAVSIHVCTTVFHDLCSPYGLGLLSMLLVIEVWENDGDGPFAMYEDYEFCLLFC